MFCGDFIFKETIGNFPENMEEEMKIFVEALADARVELYTVLK